MTEPYTSHRAAGLALLNDVPTLSHKEAGFIGHCVVADELTARQREWLLRILVRNGKAPLAHGSAK